MNIFDSPLRIFFSGFGMVVVGLFGAFFVSVLFFGICFCGMCFMWGGIICVLDDEGFFSRPPPPMRRNILTGRSNRRQDRETRN
jgi:hypothetical protein